MGDVLGGFLDSLCADCGLEGSAVVSRDGLLIAASSLGAKAEAVAAMSATLVGAAENAVRELKRGNLELVAIGSDEARLVAIGAGPYALLVVLAPPAADLGSVVSGMKGASGKIAEELKSRAGCVWVA